MYSRADRPTLSHLVSDIDRDCGSGLVSVEISQIGGDLTADRRFPRSIGLPAFPARSTEVRITHTGSTGDVQLGGIGEGPPLVTYHLGDGTVALIRRHHLGVRDGTDVPVNDRLLQSPGHGWLSLVAVAADGD